MGESSNLIREAAASALKALDARALVIGVRVLGQTRQMSRIIRFDQRESSWMAICQLPDEVSLREIAETIEFLTAIDQLDRACATRHGVISWF